MFAQVAVADMELQTKKDGKVEFDEFMHWFTKKQIGMDAGSLGWRLIEACVFIHKMMTFQ